MRIYNQVMNILSVAHSYVVDSNRQFWNQAAETNSASIDMILPLKWKSNLFKLNEFKFNPNTDSKIKNIFPMSVYFNGNGSFYHFEWIKLFQVLNSKKYDSIFIFQETWAFSLAQILFLKIFTKNRNTKVHIAVCQNIIKPKLKFLIPFEKLLMLSVERIWFCTYEIEKVLAWKQIKNKRSYLPFTFDQDIYHPLIKNVGQVVKLGFIGRISEEKGIITALEACKKLITEGYKIELHLAGGGDLVNKIDDSFVIKHGLIPHAEAHHFYHKVDIILLPSLTKKFWKEQFGRVLVESTASGTPVIGSSSGAIPEVIQFIGFGKVFRESDVDDLKNQIIALVTEMNSPGYADKINKAIKNTIKFAGHRTVSKELVNQMEKDARD